MERNRGTVNRQYDASKRRARANATRAAIVETAYRLFLAHGYAATTVGRVAADAGVSAETVYKAFGGKPGLVRAIMQRALEGEGPIPAERRSDALHEAERDGRAIIRGWGALAAEVAPRGSPIVLLVRDAVAGNPELVPLRDELDAARMARMTTNARRLADGGHLAPGVDADAAAEVLWIYSSAELYELLVLRRGWTPARYGAFIAEAMIAALLPTAGDRART
jgi:AcrR family transcriptional regulator